MRLTNRLRIDFRPVDIWLWRRGIQDPTLRGILRWQILVVALSLATGICLWGWNVELAEWWSWCGAGAALAAWNFYALIKFVQKTISKGWNKAALWGLLFHTHVKLLFTGILLYSAFVCLHAPLSALLTGMTALVTGIVAIGIKQTLPGSRERAKE